MYRQHGIMFYKTNNLSTIVCHIMILLIGAGEALRCWQCSSDTDPFCGDPIGAVANGTANGTATDCDEPWGRAHRLHSHAVCKKVTHRAVNNNLVTVRSCGWDSSGMYGWGPCSTNALSQYPAVEFCSICRRDACNDAGRQLASARTTQLVLHVSFIICGLRLQTRLHL